MHPVDSVRHRTRVELSERDSSAVIKATQEWMKQFDPNKKEDAHHLLEALWVHQQHNFRNGRLLKTSQVTPSACPGGGPNRAAPLVQCQSHQGG